MNSHIEVGALVGEVWPSVLPVSILASEWGNGAGLSLQSDHTTSQLNLFHRMTGLESMICGHLFPTFPVAIRSSNLTCIFNRDSKCSST